jgi:hypothetical protein
MPPNWQKHLFETYRNYKTDKEAEEAFMWFGGNIVECVNGKKNWKKKKSKGLLAECCTVSDEAFGLLMLDNYWDRWVDLYEKKPKTQVTKAAYTSSGAGNRKFLSWAPEGLTKFNALCKMVKWQRGNAATGALVDEQLRRRIRKDGGMNENIEMGGDLSQKDTGSVNEEAKSVVRVYNDWDDEVTNIPAVAI